MAWVEGEIQLYPKLFSLSGDIHQAYVRQILKFFLSLVFVLYEGN
ncbi:hypothetical protein SAMN04490204_3023 [Pseudomonas thivervalensis]|nr:hypothetical protein SAMN04490204_3023 [Pseudomonas thivervalensis]